MAKASLKLVNTSKSRGDALDPVSKTTKYSPKTNVKGGGKSMGKGC